MKDITKTLEQNVINFIKDFSLIEKGDRIIVALSGGPDSIFLLNFLNKYKKKYKIELAAIHINHKLRGKESDKDQKFCERVCKHLNIPLKCVLIDVKSFAKENNLSIEEAGHNIRYNEFEKYSEEINFNKIATAHNINDNAETILHRLFKNADIFSLSGIPIKRENIIRPILKINKKDIVKYLKENRIKFRTDLSNKENLYERNFIRNIIIPQLEKKINPDLNDALFNFSLSIKNIKELFDKNLVKNIINNYVQANSEEIIIDLNFISENYISDFLIKIIIKKIVNEKLNYNINNNDILNCLKLLKKQSGTTVELSKNNIAIKDRNQLIIRKKNQNENEEIIEITVGQKVNINKKILSIRKINNIKLTKNKNVEYISADNIEPKFQLRKWRYGDVFYPLGMNKPKKVSDFLIDEKISYIQKQEQLVLLNKNKIVWLVGLRIDDRMKVKPNTKNYIELKLN